MLSGVYAGVFFFWVFSKVFFFKFRHLFGGKLQAPTNCFTLKGKKRGCSPLGCSFWG